jgi:2-dehydro-3-deoxygluconokinase
MNVPSRVEWRHLSVDMMMPPIRQRTSRHERCGRGGSTRSRPSDQRIRPSRTSHVWGGWGEYNVFAAAPLLRPAGHGGHGGRDNEVGHLLEDLMLQGGVDLSHVKWTPLDGIGRASRLGLKFTEKGFDARAAVRCSDRGW